MAANRGTSGTWMRSSSLVADPVVAANSPFAAASYGGRRFLTRCCHDAGGCHADQVLSDAELAQLSGFPAEIADEDLVTYFTLVDADRRWLLDGTAAPPTSWVSGCSCAPCPGSVSSPTTLAPPRRRRCAVWPTNSPAMSACWSTTADGRTAPPRSSAPGTRPVGLAGSRDRGLQKLDDFLLARAMEHDSPTLLSRLAAEHLRAERVVRPAVDPLVRRVATARDRAWTETYTRLSTMLTDRRTCELDRLVEVDPGLGITRLVWLRRGATTATPEVMKAELEKLAYVRGLDADRLELAVPPGRRRFLAQVGRRSTPQALARAAVERRHPVLLATLAETAVEVLDELVTLFDHGLAGADSRARHRLAERAVARVAAAEDRLVLLDDLLAVLADPAVPDEAVGRLLRAGIGLERLQAAQRSSGERLQADRGHLGALEDRYAYLRSFVPAVIAALPLAGGPAARSLIQAVEVVRDLNVTGRRRVPDDAPADFVPARWQGYLDTARQADRTTDHRHYWELAVVYSLHSALHSGDIWVPGSRRYADPASHFIPISDWSPLREEFSAPTATPLDGHHRLTDLNRQLMAALAALDPLLANDGGAACLDPDGELVVSPLAAEQVPAAAVALCDEASERLPHVDLPSLLIEVDTWTGFTDHLVHAGGATHRGPDLRRNLYATVMAQATNLGFAGMADATGISEDALAWTTRWYLREETLRDANTAIVNDHHRQPLAQVWVEGRCHRRMANGSRNEAKA